MKVAILSDIHANLEALESVSKVIAAEGVDRIVCLGDVVGYGGDPEACVAWTKEHCDVVVLGNHDLATSSNDPRGLPPDAGVAVRKHAEWLSVEDVRWLATLPSTAVEADLTLVHATPENPLKWSRLSTIRDSKRQFGAFETPICFVGHSHRPYVESDSMGVFSVRRGARFLINVGSVGQPRDGDPRACFGIFHTEKFSYRLVRVPYDIRSAQARIIGRGLPETLATRLGAGA
ncbi:MAG: diadenosine tetraphosphatase ApaH/serine/threonine PP2A family protein phosphatase [Rhodothermales bacterium]|jgi:diadenosine tetraphosphatase ApaH/serine/threonine PP2A family protein phosphatase